MDRRKETNTCRRSHEQPEGTRLEIGPRIIQKRLPEITEQEGTGNPAWSKGSVWTSLPRGYEEWLLLLHHTFLICPHHLSFNYPGESSNLQHPKQQTTSLENDHVLCQAATEQLAREKGSSRSMFSAWILAQNLERYEILKFHLKRNYCICLAKFLKFF